MSLADNITNQLRRKGRSMTLRRRTGTTANFVEAVVQGYPVSFRPEEIVGAVQMGDSRVTIGPLVAGLGTPQANDMLHMGGSGWRVMGATPLHVGEALAGWRLHLRGGSGK